MSIASTAGGRPNNAPNPYELEDMLLDAEGLALALRFLLADENGDVAFASRVLIDCILERLVAAQEAKPRAKAPMGTGA
ncbi:hypothetical protein [Oceaniradius stylonematis]|uniref:hypothetical protein n=1 Tax=Oceaniradius stylonematis TaxID=2184161 RepID=UPI003B59B5CC